jgi:hypothetical protein
MEFRIAAPGQGLAWFRGAIRMIDRNPRGLIQVTSAFVLIALVPDLLGAIPAVSAALSLLLLLLGQALTAGLLHAIDEASAGRPVVLAQLFEGLRRPGVRVQLVLLGVFALVAMLLIVLSLQRTLSPQDMDVLVQVANQKIAPDSATAQAMAPHLLKAMMAGVAIAFVLLAGLFFAVPRVMFDGRGAIAAIVESFVACAANVLPLTVYGLLLAAAAFAMGLVMAFVAAIFGLFGQLGALLFVPVFAAMMMFALFVNASGNYLAWRAVFGRADAGTSAPQTGIIV